MAVGLLFERLTWFVGWIIIRFKFTEKLKFSEKIDFLILDVLGSELDDLFGLCMHLGPIEGSLVLLYRFDFQK